MTDSHKRVGLIGLSAKGTWGSQSHPLYFQKASKCKITALQNISQPSAEAAAKKYSPDGVSIHDSPNSIAQDPNADIVAVSVNVPQHYGFIRPALEGMIFGGGITENILYALNIEAGANLLTIPFGHAVDALCYVLGSELQGILVTLFKRYPKIDLVDGTGKLIEKRKKLAQDLVSITASLINDGGNVALTYAPGLSRFGHNFYWEIISSEGTLVLEGGINSHVQIFQPTVKLTIGKEQFREVEVEKAGDFSGVRKAWYVWAGTGMENGYSTTTWEEAPVKHKMIEAIYRSADNGTRENYV